MVTVTAVSGVPLGQVISTASEAPGTNSNSASYPGALSWDAADENFLRRVGEACEGEGGDAIRADSFRRRLGIDCGGWCAGKVGERHSGGNEQGQDGDNFEQGDATHSGKIGRVWEAG